MKLRDRIAIVTGSDSGIGSAIATLFAREGADVVVTWFSDHAGARRTASEIESAGRRALVVQLDQRDPARVAELFSRVQSELGAPWILVNNAGVNASGCPVADMRLEDWDNTVRTDLYGPFYCCREFIHARRSAGGRGKILNITSVHEEIPMMGAAAYDAAKGGLRNLTRTLALELAGDRINVNNVAPGMILTPMNQEAMDNPEARRESEQAIPWQRAGQPADVAKLALYLASEDADYVTGQSFFIDGGLMLNMGQGA